YLAQAGVPAPIALDLYACVNPAPPGTPTQTCNENTGRCELANRSDASLKTCAHAQPDADKICFQNGQGRCSPDDKCEGGAFAANFSPGGGVNIPVNGWRLINLPNLFASRDNLRQQVITNAQLARVLTFQGANNIGVQTGITINGNAISYVGQSLG